MKKYFLQMHILLLVLFTFCVTAPYATALEEDPISSISYTYDDVGRLIKEDYGTTATIYKYDPAGNLLEVKTGEDLLDCPLSNTLDNQKHIDRLRAFRDVRIRNSRQESLERMYYSNAGEISSVLEHNPHLKKKLQSLIENNIGIVSDLIGKGHVAVDQHVIDEVLGLLQEMDRQCSRELKKDMQFVIQEIRDSSLLKSLGVYMLDADD